MTAGRRHRNSTARDPSGEATAPSIENTGAVATNAGRGARRVTRSAATSKLIAGRRMIPKNALDGVWWSLGSLHFPASPRPRDRRDVPCLPVGSHHRRPKDGLNDTGTTIAACTLRARLASCDDNTHTITMAATSATVLGHRRQQLADRHSRHMGKVQRRGYWG